MVVGMTPILKVYRASRRLIACMFAGYDLALYYLLLIEKGANLMAPLNVFPAAALIGGYAVPWK